MTSRRIVTLFLGVIMASVPSAIALAGSQGQNVKYFRGPLDMRLNEVQVLGSHNSYHIQPEQRILDVLALFEPELAVELEYTHIPLDEQFTFQGIRQIELDIFADPNGGMYAKRRAYIVFGEDPNSGLPELDEPGLKVLHVQDIDFDTTCLTFVGCLSTIKAWSDSNPAHLPIMVLVEAKDDPIPDPINLGFVIPIPFGPEELDTIDAEILSVFPEDQLITPDDVRGEHATLEEAILEDGWPRLREVRGKILFALDNGGAVRDDYIAGHPSLAGRVLFTSSFPGEPEAGFVKLNDPIADQVLIADLVRDGFIVRTRADADTYDARAGDTTRRDAALASGAQFVSTDYPEPDPFGMGYVVTIPDGSPARCNPISAPSYCVSSALENLTGFQDVAGKKLMFRDKAGDASKRKIIAIAKDPLIDTPLPGTPDDPSIAGATLALTNPVTEESAAFLLPPGANWQELSDPPGRGYLYRDPQGQNGPCSLLLVKYGKLFKARCHGKLGAIPFSLDEASQGALTVTLQLGGANVHCMSFGGSDVKRDTQATAGRMGQFIGLNAAPGGCPIPE
jgi:hypothetical protein